MNHWLLESMASRGGSTAMIWKDATVSYDDLVAEIDRWTGILTETGVMPGERVAICGDYSPSICAVTVALIANQNVVVPLTLPAGSRRDNFFRIAQVQTSFHFEGDRFSEVARHTTDAEHELFGALRETSAPGLVLFSSGSTGPSKASLLNFDKVLAKFQKPRAAFRALTFLLIDHIGGINTLFSLLSQGGTVVPVTLRDPVSVCRAIERHGIELLPTTPTFLNMLLISDALRQHDCSSLRLITYGTEPMPPSTLRHLHAVLPGVELKQTYGLSELGILRTKSRESGSLWVKVGGEGYQTKVVDNVLWIRSASAMLGYLNAPSPFDADGWFNTGDVVEVDGEWLRILGRDSEIINVGGEKVYPAEVESVLLEVENVRDVSVVGRANPVTGKVVVARVSLRKPEAIVDVRNRIRRYCKGRLEPFKVPAIIELSDDFFHGDRFKKMRSQS